MEDSKEEVMVENGGMSGSLDLEEVAKGFVLSIVTHMQ